MQTQELELTNTIPKSAWAHDRVGPAQRMVTESDAYGTAKTGSQFSLA